MPSCRNSANTRIENVRASRGTQDLRIERAQRNQRESNLVNDEFAALCEHVRLRVSAKYGGPEQALQHLDEIKSECRVVIFTICQQT
jgi:hypothetical protein